ncbi:MAG: hypothetical protein RLZZ524_1640 [Pseudomonadota bacterium]|jgi:hypothetical protein
MKIIELSEFTDANLIASSVAEDVNPEWVPGIAYAAGFRVHRPAIHRVFERLIAGAGTLAPEADPDNWADAGPTNRWAMFDASAGTSTVAEDVIQVVIDPGIARAIGAVELRGAELNIVQREADSSANLVRNPLDMLAANWIRTGMQPLARERAIDGGLTAARLIADTAPGFHYIDEELSGLADGEVFSASIEMRPVGARYLRLGVIAKSGAATLVEWDNNTMALSLQTPGAGQSGVIFGATPLDDGWVRLTIGGISALTGAETPKLRIYARPDAGADTAGDGVSGAIAARPMIGRSYEAQPFQPATIGAKTINLIRRPDVRDWLEFFANPVNPDRKAVDTDIVPIPSTRLWITLYGVGQVSIGSIGFGVIHDGFDTLLGMRQAVRDFSVRDTNSFGQTTLRPGAVSDDFRLTLAVPADASDAVIDRISALRGRPVMVVNVETYTSTLALGWFEDVERVFETHTVHYISARLQSLA